MTEAISPLAKPTQGQTRFARIAAGTAVLLAIAGLGYGQFPLAAAGAVCAVIGLIASVKVRDIYAGAGALIAGVIALTSPVVALRVAAIQADHVAAQQASEAKVTSDIAEVEAFDAHMQAYQPNLGEVDRHAAGYARVTAVLEKGRDQYLLARSINDPNLTAMHEQLIAVANQADIQHNQIITAKTTMDQKASTLPERWSHIQALCTSEGSGV